MAKIRDKTNSFWLRYRLHLPDGVEECLAFFPDAAFEPVIIEGDCILHSKRVSNLIRDWIIQYCKYCDFNDPNSTSRPIIKQALSFESKPDPFLYAAIFFELTCYLRTQLFNEITLTRPRKIHDLKTYFKESEEFWKSEEVVTNTLDRWLDFGFPLDLFNQVHDEMVKIRDNFNQFDFFYKEKKLVRAFKVKSFETLNCTPLDAKSAHRGILFFNIYRLVSIAIPSLSKTKIYELLSQLPLDHNTGIDGVKKLIERGAQKNGYITDWFILRYLRLIKRAGGKVESSTLRLMQEHEDFLSLRQRRR